MASIFTVSFPNWLKVAADTLSSIGFAAGYGGGALPPFATSLIAARESRATGPEHYEARSQSWVSAAGVFITYRVCPDD